MGCKKTQKMENGLTIDPIDLGDNFFLRFHDLQLFPVIFNVKIKSVEVSGIKVRSSEFGVQLLKSSRAYSTCERSEPSLVQWSVLCRDFLESHWRAIKGNHEKQCVHFYSEKLESLATIVLHFIYKWGSLHQT